MHHVLTGRIRRILIAISTTQIHFLYLHNVHNVHDVHVSLHGALMYTMYCVLGNLAVAYLCISFDQYTILINSMTWVKKCGALINYTWLDTSQLFTTNGLLIVHMPLEVGHIGLLLRESTDSWQRWGHQSRGALCFNTDMEENPFPATCLFDVSFLIR